jgi:GNAT superfamily N-acetyltransferase
MEFTLRRATLDDRAAISELIALSARGLSREDYTDEQIEAALESVFGVDSDLIHDGTYLVAERDGQIVGCGGWSRRATLFGGDQFAARETQYVDPATQPARIRAFFVHPQWARRGIGSAILQRCENEARAFGFRKLALMATLPGLKLYRALGYVDGEPVRHETPNGVAVDFVAMHKDLAG